MNNEDIIVWRESMVKLPDANFFDLIQLYLGKIKTPFNKQKLVEQLSAFLRKTSVQELIIKTIDASDILILTAIAELYGVTESCLADLFETKFTYPELHEKLLNAEERLLIYRNIKEISAERIYTIAEWDYKINPVLKEILNPLLNKKVFILAEKKYKSEPQEINLSDTGLAAIYSFCFHNKTVLKNNGTLKKKYSEKLQKIFPWTANKDKGEEIIFTACENLGLLYFTEGEIILQKEKWQAFAKLNSVEKKIYFSIASIFKFKRYAMQIISQTLLEFLDSLGNDYLYSKNDLEVFFLLLCIKSFKGAVSDENTTEFKIKDKIKTLIDILIFYGILCTEENLIYRNPTLFLPETEPDKPLLINPSFEITILPNSNLTKLLEVCEFMEPVLIQTAGKFEITKNACLKFFEAGFSYSDLYDILNKITNRNIPQNITVSLSEWYANFTSLSVYSGFVVSVSKEKEKFFDYNTSIKKLIKKKLACGVYLLNIQDIKEFEKAVSSSGLDFIFYGDVQNKQASIRGLQKLDFNFEKNEFKFTEKTKWNDEQAKRCKEYNKRIDKLNAQLKEKKLPKEEEQVLKTYINRKAIILEEQIENTPIKFEKYEAAGLDFTGKQRVAETAISGNKLLEIHLNSENGMKKILCRAYEIIKTSSGADLTVYTEPDKEKMGISVAGIVKIKVIRTALLS
ncbi:helicase [Treponema pedis]|uniref:helicase n=1 Tax=Treponema pedis TaxID=409322 RepID=UPI003D1F396E